jgi:DNA replication protein
MRHFEGFADSESSTRLPDGFFNLLHDFARLEDLMVALQVLHQLDHLEGSSFLREADIVTAIADLPPDTVQLSLGRITSLGVLVMAEHNGTRLYLLNTPRGRSQAEAFQAGGPGAVAQAASMPLERPNVFRVYEDNIGPLTPLIADALRDAQEQYSPDWVTDAVELAVMHNKRSWKYCEAILQRWKEEGRAEKQNRRDDAAARQRDVEEKIRRFIES